ncbi:Peroxisomal membrane PMP30B [Lecanosticta acicola]|uniref:Peroxisomal membrane PMP30B n=1 Tax=Lecanosticta acicola TaxID=111012 RepID=A0AAI9EAG7_9PEZI|nr:Peroxisomal membrane PMP30B [Lecanosticta acicola]
MVADAVIYHPSVSHFNRFVATTVGRDKTLRTIQYFSRFLAWYLYRTNHPTSTIAPFEALKKNFSTVRKAMRIGKFVEHLKAAAVAADAKSMDPVLKYLAIGRQVGYALYLALDTVCYVDQSGVYKLSGEGGKRLQREAYRAWWVGLVCNVAAGGYTLYNLQQIAKKQQSETEDAEKKVEEKKLERERAATLLQLLSDLCDLTIPTSAIGLMDLDDGIVGLAGTVSSLIGLRAAWAKTS